LPRRLIYHRTAGIFGLSRGTTILTGWSGDRWTGGLAHICWNLVFSRELSGPTKVGAGRFFSLEIVNLQNGLDRRSHFTHNYKS
jgi:hypothetical protein